MHRRSEGPGCCLILRSGPIDRIDHLRLKAGEAGGGCRRG